MATKRKALDFSILSECRGILMGIAILLIVFFHVVIDNPFINSIREYCYGGVDIFLFVSGLGCFYSLSKNDNGFQFIKRRLSKLLPMLWIFLIIWWLSRLILNYPIPPIALLGNFLMIQDYANSEFSFNWYLSAILLFYLLAPLLYQTLKRNKPSAIIVTLLLTVILSIPFFENDSLIVIMSRLPIFYIGMIFGKICKQRKTIHAKHLILLSISAVLGLLIRDLAYVHLKGCLWSYGLHWYPFILIVPAFCIWISILCEKIKNSFVYKLSRPLNFLGKHTFEIYLCHILLFNSYQLLIADGKIAQSNLHMLICILLIAPCSILLYLSTKIVLRIASKITCGNI